MALYDNYLNQNNSYSRPASMMSDVNDYLGANQASLPMDANSLGSLMNRPSTGLDDTSGGGGLPQIDDIYDIRDGKRNGGGGGGGGGGGTSSGSDDLLAKFIGELEVLSDSQRKNLLGFIGVGGGDNTAGVSPSEYAELYGVSSDYSERFQGFPNLSSLLGDIENVFAYQNQQRGFEQRAAQQAQIAQGGGKFQGGMGFSGFGRGKGMANALNRRQMTDTLKQRQGAVDEAVAGRYGSLLNNLASKLTSGFNVAGDIVQENPQAQVDYGVEPKEGDTKYMNGINWIYIDGAWINEQAYNEQQRADS
jgi:hypothetical protein